MSVSVAVLFFRMEEIHIDIGDVYGLCHKVHGYYSCMVHFCFFSGYHFPGDSRESVRTAIIPDKNRVSAATESDPGAKYYDFAFQL